MWQDLMRALCLMLVLEGLMPFAAPGRWRLVLFSASQLNERVLRMLGLASMLVGAGLLYLMK